MGTELNNLKLDLLSFENDDKKVKYYTGLPTFKILFILFKKIEDDLPSSSKLSKFQMLILTLMKLRLGSDFTDLSYRFNVSINTASRYFFSVLDVLHIKLKNFVFWPERHLIKKTTPYIFKEAFGSTITVIVDCFEVFTEKPTNQNASSQMWSTYKHHHTIKFLIGIIPQGVITFISPAYGGRSSDKFIVGDSKFLENIKPGDIVMADRGFTISNELQLQQASLRIPTFTKNKNQLHPIDVEQTREIAHARIHVERLIGSLKQKYTIFSSVIPISMLVKKDQDITAIDKAMQICCALVNMCPSMTISIPSQNAPD